MTSVPIILMDSSLSVAPGPRMERINITHNNAAMINSATEYKIRYASATVIIKMHLFRICFFCARISPYISFFSRKFAEQTHK